MTSAKDEQALEPQTNSAHLTHHGEQRMSDRVGLNHDASQRLVDRALGEGIRPSETRGSLRRYLDGLYLSKRNATNIRVYGEHVYLFDDDRLITVLHLPCDFKRAAAKIRSRRSP